MIIRHRLGFALWYFSVVSVVAATTQNPVSVPTRTGAIQGIVTENTTGRVLDSVEVWLEDAEPAQRDPLEPPNRQAEEFPFVTLTGPDGRFLLEQIPPGEYRMFAGGEDLLQQEYGQRSPELPGRVVQLRAGEELNLDFRMLGTGTISGRVVDEAGEPVPGIPVYAEVFQFRVGKHVRVDLSRLRFGSARRVPSITPEMGYSVTDEDGAYRIAGLPPGDYDVVVRYQAGEEAREGFAPIVERDPVAPVYYPDALKVDDAVAVAVAGGEVSGIDVQWRAIPPVAVRGEVFGYDGGEGPLLLTVATPDGVPVLPLMAAPPVDPDGRFELLLPPFQSYLLTATTTRTPYYGIVRIDVSDSDQEDIDIALLPPASLSGQIVYAGPPGNVPPDFSRLTVRLQNGAERLSAGAQFSLSVVRPSGLFPYLTVPRVNGLKLFVGGLPEGYYIESAVAGGVDLLTDGLDLSEEIPGNLTIRLSSGTGEISGTVVDGRGTAYDGARVTLVPGGVYRNRYDRYKAAFTDADGRFRLDDVPLGPYQVFAWENIPIDAEMSADFLTPFLGRGRSVRIDRAGGSVEVELRVIQIPVGLSASR